MVQALVSGENVHIIAYDENHQKEIEQILINHAVSLEKVDFILAPSDDVWVRDTGPMFVFDQSGILTIADFAFDGWGKKMSYEFDDDLPKAVAAQKKYSDCRHRAICIGRWNVRK